MNIFCFVFGIGMMILFSAITLVAFMMLLGSALSGMQFVGIFVAALVGFSLCMQLTLDAESDLSN